jgi:hypothetical protein
MIATMLVGPGKPKLVQIQRPPSSPSNSAKSATPATPKSNTLEVSAFSPYDTPCDIPPQHENILQSQLPPLKVALPVSLSRSISTTLSVDSATSNTPPRTAPAPASASPYAVRKRVCQAAESPTVALQRPPDPFVVTPQRSRSRRSSGALQKRWAIRQSPAFFIPPAPDTSPTLRIATVRQDRKLDRILDGISQAIDGFPERMLSLDGFPVSELRNSEVENQRQTEALQRIFPLGSERLLGSLIAWIMVDLFLNRLKPQPTVALCRSLSSISMTSIPNKAREILGIGLPNINSTKTASDALRRRIDLLAMSIRVIGQRLVVTLRGNWDEDIWRSLKVLVEVIDGCHRSGW